MSDVKNEKDSNKVPTEEPIEAKPAQVSKNSVPAQESKDTVTPSARESKCAATGAAKPGKVLGEQVNTKYPWLIEYATPDADAPQRKSAFCSICDKITFWGPGKRAKSFLSTRPKKSRKTGTFEVRDLREHEKSKSHKYALTSAAKIAFIPRKHKNHGDTDFVDFVLWLAAQEISLLKIVSYSKLQKKKGKAFKGDREEAMFIVVAMSEFLKQRHTKELEKAFALALSFDDGTSLSTREWMSLIAKADTFEQSESYAMQMFLYAFRRLDFDELNALGLMSVVESIFGKYLTKVFWYARDGASVMKKLVELLIEKYNPFAVDV